MRPYFLAAFTAATIMLPAAALAQSLQSLGDTSAPFTLSAAPQYPAPHSAVTLSLLSTSLNLANATVTVTVNGKNAYHGAVQPVSVTVAEAGSVTQIAATINVDGTNYNKTLLIQPEDVALVAEPVSSAPVLYPGKSLVPLEGSVRVVAVANLKTAKGSALDRGTLSYSWTVDGVHIADSSGIDQKAITVASPLQYRSRTVSVVVTSRDGSVVGGDSLSLMPLEPSVRIYENDPLLGILFDRALFGGYTIANTESNLYATPFSLPIASGAPIIQWFLNGAAVQAGPSITLRPSGNGQGAATLSLTASGGKLTSASADLPLSFSAKSSTNLFGL